MNYIDDIGKKKIDLFKIIRELNNKNCVSGSSGNISIKIDENRYIITPSGKLMISLKKEDILLIDSNGRIIGENNGKLKASSEALMHLFCYRKRNSGGYTK